MNANDTQKQILDALNEQLECYRQIIDRVRQQQEALADEDDERLFKAVAAKNPWVQKAHRAEKAIADGLTALSPGQREDLKSRAGGLKDEIYRTLGELIRMEEACAQALEAKKIEIHEQLLDLKSRKKGIRGYEGF